jgi:hypothetical protein
MPIKISNELVNTQTFELEGRQLIATYTPEVDEEFGNLLVDIDELNSRADSVETDKMTVSEKKKFLNETTAQIISLTKGYIEALFRNDDAQFIIEKSGGRAINLARLAGTFYKNGNEERVIKNRKQRRQENK